MAKVAKQQLTETETQEPKVDMPEEKQQAAPAVASAPKTKAEAAEALLSEDVVNAYLEQCEMVIEAAQPIEFDRPFKVAPSTLTVLRNLLTAKLDDLVSTNKRRIVNHMAKADAGVADSKNFLAKIGLKKKGMKAIYATDPETEGAEPKYVGARLLVEIGVEKV